MAEGGRAGEQAHIGWRTERAETGLEPVVPAGAQQPAAELGLLIDQDHPVAGLTRFECCGDSGTAPADHQHFAVCVDLVVPMAIRLQAEAAAAVQADRLEPVDEADLRRAKHGVVAYLHERVRFLDAGGKDTTRTSVGDAVCHDADVIRQQRRCQVVAFVAAVRRAIETELDRTRSIDAAARGEAAHAVVIWCVTVSRTRVNQRRQPAVCTQRSVIWPLGFGRKKTNRAQVASSTASASLG